MGIRPYAEALLQGAEQALSLDGLKASEKVHQTTTPSGYTLYY